jgi:hypothetical protein
MVKKKRGGEIGKGSKSSLSVVFVLILFGILMLGVVLGGWKEEAWKDINYTVLEDQDPPYIHDLTKNVTESVVGNVSFTISTDGKDNITWINFLGNELRFKYGEGLVDSWFKILNSTKGDLKINATNDNQTGFFRNVPIRINDEDSEGQQIDLKYFNFIIKAVNDAPEFVNFQNNITKYIAEDESINLTLNAIDEEGHYPINFSVIFNESCQVPERNPRYNESGNHNCTLPYEFFSTGNTSNILSFKDLGRNDTGIYNMTLCVNDTVEGHNLPLYRVDDYNESRQTCELFTLDLRADLRVKDINCSGINVSEGNETFCQIKVETEHPESNLSLWSIANFTEGYLSPIDYNISWFYPNITDQKSQNFVKIVNITLSPGKSEIGIWNVTFWAHDTPPESLYNASTTPQFLSILINVTQASNETPVFEHIVNVITSIDKVEEIFFNVSDNDLLIPDKRVYNESFNFSYSVLNQTSLAILPNFPNFEIVSIGQSGNKNISRAKIILSANSSEAGNYTINLSVEDNSGKKNFTLFNLTIMNNTAPKWNETKNYFFNGTAYSGFNETNFLIINLSEKAYDLDDDDEISFYYENTMGGNNLFNSTTFNSITGIINLTLWKEHVGFYEYNITARDKLGLINTTRFSFNITNINSVPSIVAFSEEGPDEEVLREEMVVNENENVTFYLKISDFDILINQTNYLSKANYSSNYSIIKTENISVSVNITNLSYIEVPILFDFFDQSSEHTENIEDDERLFESKFIPNKSNVGNYTIIINASDTMGAYDIFSFNLTIKEYNYPPELINITNLTSAVDRNFIYQFKANDTEDGNSWENLVFTFELNDTNIFNLTTFNSTTGEINITFNSSHAGKHFLNITVIDSGLPGRENENESHSETFWLYIYDIPKINYFNISNLTNLSENQTIEINVSANHTIGDNLIYELWMDRIECSNSSIQNCSSDNNLVKRINKTDLGNGTEILINLSLDFNDETYGLEKNLTLIVYPENSNLENNSLVFNSSNILLNISHSNAPVEFEGTILVPPITGTKAEINLSNYFSDTDYEDLFYNQIVNFTVLSNESNNSKISWTISDDWILTLSSTQEVVEILQINATDLNKANESLTFALSNNFTVEFKKEPPPSGQAPPPGGGSTTQTRDVPVPLKLIVPGAVSTRLGRIITIPLELHNDGSSVLRGIDLFISMAKDGFLIQDYEASFSQSYFEELKPGEKKNITLTVNADLSDFGFYEITLNATSQSPKYHDWGKVQLVIQESDTFLDRIIFAEELIAENPECLEIREVLERARALYDSGMLSEALELTNDAINACRNAVSQRTVFPRSTRLEIESRVFDLLIKFSLFAVAFGLIYYLFKRRRLRKQ